MQKKFIPFSIVIIFLTLSLCACTGPSNDQKTSDHKQPVSKKNLTLMDSQLPIAIPVSWKPGVFRCLQSLSRLPVN